MSQSQRILVIGLAGVILGLIGVGFASGTIVRHLIQVLPVVVVAVAAIRGGAWAPLGAMAVLVFWFLIMLAIWLWLLGLANVASGRFTPSEIVLTVIIGGSCGLGMVGAIFCRPRLRWSTAVSALVAAGALQVAAMWLSLQPWFAKI